MNYAQILTALELGLIFSLTALAVYLSFRVIDFPDLTADGSFPLGGAIMAASLQQSVHPVLALLLVLLCGASAGFVTAYLHTRFKITKIMASILTMTALYSINLRIMGQPNLIFTHPFISNNERILLICGIVIFILMLLVSFLKSETGLAMRATGQNHKLAQNYGINPAKMQILTLAISNGIIALSGALFALIHGFADISVGPGTIIIGLASVIIGEKLLQSKSPLLICFATICGSLIYRFITTLALNLDGIPLEASDLNLVTSLLVVALMLIPFYRFKV
jgi:putative ABC transport system permease protein